jgi:outer membrane protein TolC
MQVQARVKNGAVLSTNADVIQAELLKAEQQQIELKAQRNASLQMLALLTGLPLTENTNLITPEVNINTTASLENRPETTLFNYQRQSIEASKDLAGIKLNPQFSAFAQLGYGRPGLNLLDNSFTDFYILGARLHWNIWDWNATKNEKQRLDIQKNLLQTQEDAFALNTNISLTQKENEINKMNALIDKDQAIISIRSKIKETASSQLHNGVITATDFVDDLNAENQARLNLELHRLQLVKAQVEYQNLLGK